MNPAFCLSHRHLNPWFQSLALMASASLAFVAQAEDHSLRIHRAIEVEFETERGRIHHLQGSDDLQHWTNIDSGTPGRGNATSTLLSIQASTNGSFSFFRVVTEEIPTHGPAPLTLLGSVLQLDDTWGDDALRFLTETNGIKSSAAPDPFNYLLTRLSTNELQLELTRPGESVAVRRDLVSLTFSTPTTGNWVRDTFRKGRLKDRTSGHFTLTGTPADPSNPQSGGSPTNTAPTLPTEIPGNATGLAFTFGAGEHRERVEMIAETVATVFGDDSAPDDSHGATYSYARLGTNQATLVVHLKSDRRDEYLLTYKSASQGTFVRREIKNDQLDDTDTGAFSVALSATGGSNGSGETGNNNGTGAVEVLQSLLGQQLSFDDDLPADIYTFSSETVGKKTHGTDQDPFTYTYTVTGQTTARFVATFKPDRWSEFQLTFLGDKRGAFIRTDFDKNTFKQTKSGRFRTL